LPLSFYETVRPRLGEHRQSGFDFIFQHLQKIDKPFILETGCARKEDNWFGDGLSSLLFDKYVQEYGGKFITIDISEESVIFCKSRVSNRTEVILGDSVKCLCELNQRLLTANEQIDLLYLDSMDAPRDRPEIVFQSAIHHLYEFITINRSLKPGALVCVDDNWLVNNMLDGKGKLIADYFHKIGKHPVKVGYQIIWLC
jgi:predicted O-methyltransferase YrrM